MESTLYIDTEGNITGLSDELFDKLGVLGRREVRRVSDIEFDEVAQEWVATTKDGVEIGRHTDRASLILIERNYLNKQLEADETQETRNTALQGR